MRMWLTVAGMALLGGCSMGADLNAGKAAVGEFHQRYDNGDFAAIDAAAGAEIKAEPGGLTPILAAVQPKLGKVKSSSETGFNDRLDNGDHRLELAYDTSFEKAPGNEQFVFRLTGGKAVLIGYHVNSAALLK